MGLIVDDHDKNLHAEVRRESFVIFTDHGKMDIELGYDQLEELEYLIAKIKSERAQGGRMTTNPICQHCGLEMEVEGIGWLAVYMAFDPPMPYEVRRGDLCMCRECKMAVLTKFAEGRPMGHFMGEPFEQEIRSGLETGKFVLVWEHPLDHANVITSVHEVLRFWLEKRQAARKEGRQ